jgi:hypothetical protein
MVVLALRFGQYLARPREAPLYVSGKFAYFWAKNWPYLSGNLHILSLPDHPKE